MRLKNCCGRKHWVHRSCGNRHCPQCQQHKTRQMPVPYFLLTFTVPAPLRHFLRSHKKTGYGALFRASTQAIRKLARYVFRVAISNSRLLSCQKGVVIFSFREKKTGEMRRVHLKVTEFIRRFLDHLLPEGFQKVSHYGFLSPTCSLPIERVRLLMARKTGRPVLIDWGSSPPAPGLFCPDCGEQLRLLAVQLPRDRFFHPALLAWTG